MNRGILIDRMSKRLEKGEGAIFVGSGISASSTKANWFDLLLPLTSQLGIDLESADDFPLIAQFIVNSYSGNRGPLLHDIYKTFNKKFQINNYHKYLSTTNVSTIWTTNYDTLLETAFSDFNVSVKSNDDSISRNIAESDIEIIKMHGCIQSSKYDEIVITQEDYDDFLLNRPAMAQRLSEDLTNKSFLFIGYSFRDPDINNILISARRLIKKHTREHFLITMENYKNKEERKRQELWCNDLKRFGISTLLIRDYNELEKILMEISGKSRGKTVFVTGSHESNDENYRELGQLLAKNSEVILLSGQSSGVGSNVIAAFTEEYINSKNDIMSKIRIFPNPYSANEKYSNDPALIPDLKRCRIKLLNSAQIVVVFKGGIGTEAEIDLAINQNCYLIPVILKKEDRENNAIKKILYNKDNMEILEIKANNYYKKLMDENYITNMIDVDKCIKDLFSNKITLDDERFNIEINNNKKDVKLKKKTGFVEVGRSTKTLVNALIGANDLKSYELELEKIDRIKSMSNGPDILTDLSIVKRSFKDSLWYKIANETPFISATLPIYIVSKKNDKLDEKELLDIIIEQIENGVGMITIHPTANKKIYDLSKNRIVPITSRGGGMVLKDLISRNFKEENIYIKLLPEIIKHSKKNSVVLSIGATFRSSNILDSCDRAQLLEIEEQIKIADEIHSNGVGVILESPGHAKPKHIKELSCILKKTGYPIMPLGPIPTEMSIGMDHVSATIGATIMGLEGCTNIISTVTREEHTGNIPSIESVIEAIESARIAAHIIDIDKTGDLEEDKKIALNRAQNYTCVYGKMSKYCTRCNDLCPLSIT
ncbi:phosphomethylpyrimidine synthase ThiC [Tissierella sp.]|uniref:phosphomethylpyrimidine synthase ThiC n=1 Tax=Tissierella sp. TaxID=41274 RepID=UPI002859DF87|nr:phosphomethylpyrimidine synthase ThiC [Tissierella sp.]MDR7857792.1 phosphomethylpyrimidine synthase ThiC [Tissierella sp.]